MGGYQLCHSPGLRDGVSCRGASATLPSPIHGKEFSNGRILRRGINSDVSKSLESTGIGVFLRKEDPGRLSTASDFAGRTALCPSESFAQACRLNRTESCAITKSATICGDVKKCGDLLTIARSASRSIL